MTDLTARAARIRATTPLPPLYGAARRRRIPRPYDGATHRSGGDSGRGIQGLEGGGDRVLRRARGGEHEGVLAAQQGRLRDARSRPDGGAARGPGARVGRGQDLPPVPGRAVQRGQVAVQDEHRRRGRGRLHPALGRGAGRRQRHVADGARPARSVPAGGRRRPDREAARRDRGSRRAPPATTCTGTAC